MRRGVVWKEIPNCPTIAAGEICWGHPFLVDWDDSDDRIMFHAEFVRQTPGPIIDAGGSYFADPILIGKELAVMGQLTTAVDGEGFEERIEARLCRLTDRFLDGDSIFADDQELVDWINGISIAFANHAF